MKRNELIRDWITALAILAVAFVAMACAAPPKVAVAIAEAEARAKYEQRETLPSDFQQDQNSSRGAAGDQNRAGVAAGDAEPVTRSPASPRILPSVESGIVSNDTNRFAPSMTVFNDFHDQYSVEVDTADWCGPCLSAQQRDGDGNNRVRLKWIKQKPPAGIPEAFPTYRWRDASGRWRYIQGVQTLDKLLAVIERNNPPQSSLAYASRAQSGGVMKTGGMIASGLALWDEHIGAGETLTVRIDRTGLQSLSVTKLLKGRPWTPEMVSGKFGHVSLSTSSTKLPGGLQELGFTYKILDDGRFSIDLDPITVRLPGEQPKTVQAYGIDPLSVAWSVYSVASALYQMLNPQVDVRLGGCVEATAKLENGTLSISFSECPSIHVSAWFQFDLDVQRVDISTTLVHLQFKPQPQNWIQVNEKEFLVDDSASFSAVGASIDEHPTIESELEAAMAAAPDFAVYGSPVQDLRAKYANAYRKAHALRLGECDHCEGCGIGARELAKQGGHLETHHLKSVKRIFEEKLDPDLVADPANLAVVCRNGGCECHFCICHDPDGPEGPDAPKWSESNPHAKRDLARHLKACEESKRAADKTRP